MIQNTKKFYDCMYKNEKLNAQRRWPNEEFSRFMGRNFFMKSDYEREKTKILEVGCGTGANLRVLIEEGFDTYGIELSKEAIDLVPFLLGKNIDNSKIICGNMVNLPWEEDYFHAIVDVFASYCLDETKFALFVDEIYRTLCHGGKYFSYTPSKRSEAFINYKPAKKIDNSTLDGIWRKDSPYYGNSYPFRFMKEEDVEVFFDKERFIINYMEKISRTYDHFREQFEFLVFEAIKR